MVDSENASASYLKNPYVFDSFKASEIGFYLNNIPLPSHPLKLNFGDTAYESHFIEAGQRLREKNPESIISLQDFHRGYSIFRFDLTRGENLDELQPNTHQGVTKLEIRFAEALKQTIVLFLYGKFRSLLTIDASRNVIIE
jgi:hypothetical protein